MLPKQVNLAIVPSQVMTFSKMAAISETKRRRTFNFDCIYRFCEAYCEMYHATLSDIVKAILQNGGHFQSNTSISEIKRHRAFNVDSIYRFCGA